MNLFESNHYRFATSFDRCAGEAAGRDMAWPKIQLKGRKVTQLIPSSASR